MHTLSPALSAHLEGGVTTLATCWVLRLRDGTVAGFTTHDRALRVGTILCQPARSFTPSAVASSNALNVDDLEVAGALSSAAISEADLKSGRYDFAEVTILLVNWTDPEAGFLTLKSGWIGEVTLRDGQFMAEIRGLTDTLQQTFAAVCSPECRADLGDRRCRVDLSAFSVTATVTGDVDARTFHASALDQPDGWFAYGRLRWTSGANAGQSVEIRSHAGGQIGLFDEMPRTIASGDTFTVTAGCDKRFTTCRTKFDNVVNFRGEPHVPGADAVLNYPGIR